MFSCSPPSPSLGAGFVWEPRWASERKLGEHGIRTKEVGRRGRCPDHGSGMHDITHVLLRPPGSSAGAAQGTPASSPLTATEKPPLRLAQSS